MTTLSRRNLLKVSAGLVPAVALPASPARAAAPTLRVTGVMPAQLAPFDEVMKTFIRERGISCAQLAVVKSGKLVLTRGYRYTDDAAVPVVQPTSLFRIASLSKNITAAAILRLAQDGKLDLGAKVDQVLGLPRGADPRLGQVNMWRLMQHTGGWDKAISEDPLWMSVKIADALGVPLPVTRKNIVDYVTARPLDFAPGSRMAYSNYGYLLLGQVIEKLSGQSYESYVRQKLLAPAKITRMRLGRSLKSQAAPGEVPYFSTLRGADVVGNSGAIVPQPYGGFNMENQWAGGGWLASAVDMVKWAGVFNAPGPVLNATSISRAFAKPELGVNEGGYWYGCGWYARQVTGNLNTWHSGGMPGTYTYLARLQHGFTYAVLFNRREEQGTLDYDVISSRINAAYSDVTSWPTADLTSRYF